MNGKVRYNGIDIIKLIAIVFVPFLHYYINFNFETMKMVGAGSLVKIAIRWLSFSCIGLFLASSGYLLSKKKMSKTFYLKSIRIYIVYLIFVFLTNLYHNGFTVDFFAKLYKSFFSYGAYFWYIPFYLVIYYLVPYLNIISEHLNKKDFQIFLIILLVLISLPDFYNSFPGYDSEKYFYMMNPFSMLYPFIYYYIGAYFRKFNPYFSKRRASFILIITIIIVTCLDFTYSKGGKATFYGGGYGNIVSMIVTACIFSIFYNIVISNKLIAKIIKFGASLTLETYLALALSDRFTEKVLGTIVNIDKMPFKYIFISSSLNFLFAFLIAIVVHIFVVLTKKIFLEKKQ